MLGLERIGVQSRLILLMLLVSLGCGEVLGLLPVMMHGPQGDALGYGRTHLWC